MWKVGMDNERSGALLTFISISLLVLILASSSGFGVVLADGADLATLTQNPTIRVNNDTELASLIATNHWDGNGTASSPYIIRNLNINATDGNSLDLTGNASTYDSNAIYIGNTSMHLTISNCHIENFFAFHYANHSYSYTLEGIKLFNVTNVLIEHNNFGGDGKAIFLDSSRYNTISNNSANEILLIFSNDNHLMNNICNAGGIDLVSSCNNMVSNNECNESTNYFGDGITLTLSNYNMVLNNYCCGTGTGHTFGLSLIGSNNNSISNNTCKGNVSGIALVFSNYNTISNNDCSGNRSGIDLEPMSDNNYFFGNKGTVLDETQTKPNYDAMPVFVISMVLFAIVTAILILGWKRKIP
jgi:parallel beta-helix repeat protein